MDACTSWTADLYMFGRGSFVGVNLLSLEGFVKVNAISEMHEEIYAN